MTMNDFFKRKYVINALISRLQTDLDQKDVRVSRLEIARQDGRFGRAQTLKKILASKSPGYEAAAKSRFLF